VGGLKRHDLSARPSDGLSLHVVEVRKADRLRRGAGDDAGVNTDTDATPPRTDGVNHLPRTLEGA
jgi:hypothetical protein